MKKTARILIFVFCLLIPISAFAKNESVSSPALSAIEFNNAVINEDFSQDVFEYTITLDDPTVTPTLKSYKINGSANIFITYEQDETRHQTGIIVTLEFDNGSVYYTFRYSNPVSIEKSSNNLLADARCRLGEVYPKINDSDRNYRLYIPSDLTEINLSVAAQDTGATYDLPKSLKVSPDQEPTIMLDVFASNGEKRTYSFEVKRLNKNCSQVEKEMASPDFESLVKGEFFYQKPAFKIGITCAIAGILLIFVFIKIAKRLTIKVEDNDELNFFD